MRKTIYETNYDRVIKLGIVENGQLAACKRSQSNGFMDLVVEALPHLDNWNNQSCKAFSMAHYFEQNGDLCKDPEMVVLIYSELHAVEAFSFQQDLPPIYQEVFPEQGKVFPGLKKELNRFLRQWLTNLIEQGHGKRWVQGET